MYTHIIDFKLVNALPLGLRTPNDDDSEEPSTIDLCGMVIAADLDNTLELSVTPESGGPVSKASDCCRRHAARGARGCMLPPFKTASVFLGFTTRCRLAECLQ